MKNKKKNDNFPNISMAFVYFVNSRFSQYTKLFSLKSLFLGLLATPLLLPNLSQAQSKYDSNSPVVIKAQRLADEAAQQNYISSRNDAIAYQEPIVKRGARPRAETIATASIPSPILPQPNNEKIGLATFPLTYKEWVEHYALKHGVKFCPKNSCATQAVLTISKDTVRQDLVLHSKLSILSPQNIANNIIGNSPDTNSQTLELFTVYDSKNQEMPFKNIEVRRIDTKGDNKENKANFSLSSNGNQKYISLVPGEYDITLHYDLKDAQLIRPSQKLAIFLNESDIKTYYRKSDNLIKLNINEPDAPKEEMSATPQLEVFRLFKNDKPATLTTRIQISYGGAPQEFSLGSIIPANFEIIGYSSTVPLRQNPGEANIKAYLTPGRHTITLNSQSSKAVNSITVAGLINTIGKNPVKEIWSVAPSDNEQSQIELFNDKKEALPSIDASAAYVPNEWRGFNTYAADDKIVVQKINPEVKGEKPDVLNATIYRNTWLGLGGVIHKDYLNLTSEQGGKIGFKEEVNVEAINRNNQPLLVSKAENNQQKTVNVYPGSNAYELITSTPEGDAIPLNFINKTQNSEIENWILNVAPRQRVVGYKGADKIAGSWVDNWTLYSIFGLFLITLSFYKLFGWRVALFAFASIIINAHNTFFAWSVWPCILIFMAMVKVLRNPKYGYVAAKPDSSNTQSLETSNQPMTLKSSAMLQFSQTSLFILFVGLVIWSTSFSLQEIREIINPSLEMYPPAAEVVPSYMRTNVDSGYSPSVSGGYDGLYRGTLTTQLFSGSQVVVFMLYLAAIIFAYKAYVKFKNRKQEPTTSMTPVVLALMIAGIFLIMPSIIKVARESATGASAGGSGITSGTAVRSIGNESYEKSGPVPAAAPAPSALLRQSAPEAVSDLAQKSSFNKNQVSSGKPTWNGQRLQVSVSQHDDNAKLKLYVAPVWLVDIGGIIQMAFFWLVCYFIFTFIYFNGLLPEIKNIKLSRYIKNYWRVA